MSKSPVEKAVSFGGSPDAFSHDNSPISSAQRRRAFIEQTKRRKSTGFSTSFLVSRESWDMMKELEVDEEDEKDEMLKEEEKKALEKPFEIVSISTYSPPEEHQSQRENKEKKEETNSNNNNVVPHAPPIPKRPAGIKRTPSLSKILPIHTNQIKSKWKDKLLSPVSASTPESKRRNRTFEVLNEFADLELQVENSGVEEEEEEEENEQYGPKLESETTLSRSRNNSQLDLSYANRSRNGSQVDLSHANRSRNSSQADLHSMERSRSRNNSNADFSNFSHFTNEEYPPMTSPPPSSLPFPEIEIKFDNFEDGEERKEELRSEEEIEFQDFSNPSSTYSEWASKLAKNALMALIIFLIVLPSVLSFANIMTSHPSLKILFPVIIKALVATHMINQIIATLASGVHVNIPGVHTPNVMFLALIGENIADNAKDPQNILPTFIFCVCLSTIIVGITFIVAAYTNSIVLVQYIPYPVMAGFLAAISLFLMKGAITMMAGMSLDNFDDVILLFESKKFLLASIGIFLAISLFTLERFKKHILFMPAFLFIPLTIFWIAASINHTPISELQSMGFLLPTTETVPFYSVWQYIDLSRVEWKLVPLQLPNIIAMTVLIILSTTVNLNGLEFDLNRAINGKSELYVAGTGTIAASICSGLAAAITISLTGVAFRQGCNRLVGFFLTLLYFGMFILELPITDYIPKFFFGTVLFFNGSNLLWAWLILPFYTIPRFEYILLLATALAILVFGNNIGLPLSVGISAIFFAIQYARIRSIRRVFQGVDIHSKVQRPYFQRKVLEHYQGKMLVLVLQNYLFFGSSIRIHDYIYKHLKDEPKKTDVNTTTEKISKGFRRIASTLNISFGSQKYSHLGDDHENNFELEPADDIEKYGSVQNGGRTTHKRKDSKISLKEIGGKMKGFLEGLSKEKRSTKVRYLILDFASVPGVDSSSCSSFRKIVQLCKSRKITVIFTGMPFNVEKIFKRRDVLESDNVKCYADMDLALEWCENLLIKSKVKKLGTQLTEQVVQDSLEDYIPSFHVLLSNILPPGSGDEAVSEIVTRYFQKRRLGIGEFLFVSGQPSTSLFYIKSGELSYYHVNPDGERTRLYKTLQGTWAGANSLLGLSETLTLEAEGNVVVYELSKQNLQKMEEEAPEIGHAVFTAVLQSMAQTLNILVYSLRIK